MALTPFLHRHRVTYAECTLGNHVYHSRYLDILEAARGQFMRNAGQPLLLWQERGLVFPIVACRLEYRCMARYDDELTIAVWLTRLHGARLNFAYAVRLADDSPVLSGETFHVCAGLDEKPRRLPPELLAALRSWWVAQDPAAP